MTPRQMPALRRKQEISSSSTASAAIGRKGNTGFASVSLPLPLPGISSRFKHSPDFSGIQSESCEKLFDRLPDHIFAVGMHALARTGMHYHRRPFFRKKPRISCPANLLENDFPPGYLFYRPFISQNLRIILTHNHRRRCGKISASARSARFPQIFAKSSTVDVSVSRISNSASARPEMMLETSPP